VVAEGEGLPALGEDGVVANTKDNIHWPDQGWRLCSTSATLPTARPREERTLLTASGRRRVLKLQAPMSTRNSKKWDTRVTRGPRAAVTNWR
jgi:hypothetical protein